MRLAINHGFLQVCALCMLLGATGNVTAASLIVNGDFNSLPDTSTGSLAPNAGAPIGGWQIESYAETKTSVVTVGTIPGTSNRALWIHGDGTSSGGADKGVGEQEFSQAYTRGEPDKLVVQYDETMIQDYLSDQGVEMILMDGSFASRGPEIQARQYGGVNLITAYSDTDAGNVTVQATFTIGQTYSYRVSTDLITNTFDLYMRGGTEYGRWTQVGKQLPFRITKTTSSTTPPTKLDRIAFGKFTSYVNTYVDNVMVESSDTFYTGDEYDNNFNTYSAGNLLGQDGWRLGKGLTSSAQVVSEGAGKAISVSGTTENANLTSIYQDLDAIVESGTVHFTFDGKWAGGTSSPNQVQIAVGDSTLVSGGWTACNASFGMIGNEFYAANGDSESEDINVLSGISAVSGKWYSFDAKIQMTGAERNTWSLEVSDRDSGAVVWDTKAAGISLGFVGDYIDITRMGLLVDAADGAMLFDNFSLSATPTDAPYRPGDANYDGKVDGTDAAALATNWLSGPNATWANGDFNEDGYVNDLDAAIMAANWSATSAPSASVPEPSSMALLCLGGLFALVCCHRRRLARKDIFMKTVLACMLCLGLAVFSAQASASLIVNGNFDSLAVGTAPNNSTPAGGWQINADNQETDDSVVSIGYAPGTSNKALHIQGGDWTRGLAEQVFTSSYVSAANKLVLEYDLITVDDPCADAAAELYMMGGDFAHRGPAIAFKKTGYANTITFISESTGTGTTFDPKVLGFYTPGETYRVRVSTSMETNKYDVYIRGGEYARWKQVGTDLPFRHTTAESAPTYIDRISFGKFGSNQNSYVDNVVVQTTDDEAAGVRFSNNFESGYTLGSIAGQNGWGAKEGELSRMQIVNGGAGCGNVVSMTSSSETYNRAILWQDMDTIAEAGEVSFKVDALVSGSIASENIQFAIGGDSMISSGSWPYASAFSLTSGKFYVYDGNGTGGGTNVSTGISYAKDTWYTFEATMWMSGIDKNTWKLVVTERDSGAEVLDTDDLGLALDFRTRGTDITRYGTLFQSSGGEMRFDNVELSVASVVAAVPEPSVIAMLLCGFAALLMFVVRGR